MLADAPIFLDRRRRLLEAEREEERRRARLRLFAKLAARQRLVEDLDYALTAALTFVIIVTSVCAIVTWSAPHP